MRALAHFDRADEPYVIRRAVAGDVPAIVERIPADQIGQDRDGGDLGPYLQAFAAIDTDPAQLLVVVADAAGAVVATLQLSFSRARAPRGTSGSDRGCPRRATAP